MFMDESRSPPRPYFSAKLLLRHAKSHSLSIPVPVSRSEIQKRLSGKRRSWTDRGLRGETGIFRSICRVRPSAFGRSVARRKKDRMECEQITNRDEKRRICNMHVGRHLASAFLTTSVRGPPSGSSPRTGDYRQRFCLADK